MFGAMERAQRAAQLMMVFLIPRIAELKTQLAQDKTHAPMQAMTNPTKRKTTWIMH